MTQRIQPTSAPATAAEPLLQLLIEAPTLEAKLDAADGLGASILTPDAAPKRLVAPGRAIEFTITRRAAKRPKNLDAPVARAKLFHTFAHHELQAAELFAWATLAFADAPLEFRRGLVRLCREEFSHLRLYVRHLESLGSRFGEYPVRDWFWERVPSCPTPAAFVAFQGLGLEGANLEHSARYAAAFEAVGDDEGARILREVERDEISHVEFAKHWFEVFTEQALDYDTFRDFLPRPLTPAVLRGRPLNLDARRRAGFDDAFLERLAAEPGAEGTTPKR